MRFFAYLFCCFSVILSAEIVEIQDLSAVEAFLHPDDLLVLDVDNTLLCPVQQLGSDQWFYHRMVELQEQGMAARPALEKALLEWEAVQNLSDMRPTEPGAAALVASWQQRPVHTLGLTTRGMGMAHLTLAQLANIGITLGSTAPSADEFYWKPADRGVVMRGGIVFTAGSHKGKAFAAMLQEFGLQPKRVVFVNDKASHLAELGQTVESMSIPFLGLRYAGCDAWVASFDPAVAAIQRAVFARILSDAEAQALLEQSSAALSH